MSERDLGELFEETLVTVEPRPAWNDVLARTRRSRRRFGAAIAAVLLFVLVPAAWAINRDYFSNPDVLGGIGESGLWVCGPHQAAQLTGAIEQQVPVQYEAGLRPAAPAQPQAFYRVDLNGSTVCSILIPPPGGPAYFVPGTGEVRIVANADTAFWVKLAPDVAAELRQAVRTVKPYPTPTTLASVSVNDQVVAHPSSYLRLYTIGRPVETAPRGIHWISIFLFGARPASPWTDGKNALAVSSSGQSYLRRDGQVMHISASLAARIRRGAQIPK